MKHPQEVQLLCEKSDKYLQASKLLIDSGFYDSAVSRAYYAMFYMVQAVLLSEDIAVSTHKGLISKFGELFIKTSIFEKEIAYSIAEAFDKRSVAEYDISQAITLEVGQNLFVKAQNFCETLKYYLDNL